MLHDEGADPLVELARLIGQIDSPEEQAKSATNEAFQESHRPDPFGMYVPDLEDAFYRRPWMREPVERTEKQRRTRALLKRVLRT